MDEPQVRARFRAAEADFLAQLQPPELGTIRRRMNRRRRRNGALAVAAIVVVIGVLIPLLTGTDAAVDHRRTPAVVPSSAPPSTSPSTSPSLTPSTSPSPPSPSGTPLKSPPPFSHGSPTGRGATNTPHSTTKAPTVKTTTCDPRDYAEVTYPNGDIELNGDSNGYYHLCPGQSLRAFWVQYEFQPDGSQTVFAEHVANLTTSHPTDVSPYPTIPAGTCAGDQYIVAGSFTIRATIAPGKHDPYPGFKDYKGGMISGSYATACS